jgi:hypothetical protein
MHRRLRSIILASVGAAALAIPTGAVFAATPVDSGCPASSEPVSVAYIESLGDYHVPGRLDDPANGGNGDGYVCAFPLPEAVATAWGLAFGNTDLIYQFFENNSPAEGRP